MWDNVTFVGPGHGSVVSTDAGEDWFVYHAWPYGQIGQPDPGRMLMLDKILWTDEHWPIIGVNGHPSVDSQLKPNICP